MYHTEQGRLDSFSDWKLASPTPNQLAAVGFYYTGDADRVRCFECKIEIRNWDASKCAFEQHKKWMPRCSFIKGNPTGNLSVREDHVRLLTCRVWLNAPIQLSYMTIDERVSGTRILMGSVANRQSSHIREQIQPATRIGKHPALAVNKGQVRGGQRQDIRRRLLCLSDHVLYLQGR